MRRPNPGMMRGTRSFDPISKQQEKKILAWWVEMGGDPDRIVIHREAGGRSYLDAVEGVIHIGSDLNPVSGSDPNARMRWRAALAHELRHLQRCDEGRIIEPIHLDEAVADLEACAFPQLTPAIREELAADALQRLYCYLEERKEGCL
ncbi:MAG: hypothetical protein JXR73_11055 [Candidatus Omnitrophica bacterium]|nr:hypothetical protein [Candidatus Omnitrophota bacterium]